MNNKELLLEIKDLRTYFYTQKGIVKAVDNLDLSLEKGKTLCIVGESGCGKSVTSLSIMRLIQSPPGKIVSGTIKLNGVNLLDLSENEMRKIRGDKISMIFQEPMTSLNPVFRIGDQISEVYIVHHKMNKEEALKKSIEMLKMVGIPSPDKRVFDYPHQLSGGMRQRVMIAMALASPNPLLLLADEPTTALDVTIQAQILQLMNELKERIGMSIILITHDMNVVSQMADQVIVMYAGKKIEEANVIDLFENPLHPYTNGLLNSIPSNKKYQNSKRLETIRGTVPNLLSIGSGCPFSNRCDYAEEICEKEFPPDRYFENNHLVRCHFVDKIIKGRK